MSLLHQETPQELDDAARGESFTRGTSHIVWAGIAAFFVVSVAIFIYVFAGEKPAVATGVVLEAWAHPMHTVTPGFDASGSAMSQEAFDQATAAAKAGCPVSKLYNTNITLNAALS